MEYTRQFKTYFTLLLVACYFQGVFNNTYHEQPKYHLPPESMGKGVPFTPKNNKYSMLHQPVTSKDFDPISKSYAMNMSISLKEIYSNDCKYNTGNYFSEEQKLIDEVSSFDYSHYPDGTLFIADNCYSSRHLEGSSCLATCAYCIIKAILPDRYKPRYIKEKRCSLSSSYCISGNGSCEHEEYHLQGLKYTSGDRDNMKNWEEFGMTLKSGCSCKILSDKPLSEFVD